MDPAPLQTALYAVTTEILHDITEEAFAQVNNATATLESAIEGGLTDAEEIRGYIDEFGSVVVCFSVWDGAAKLTRG